MEQWDCNGLREALRENLCRFRRERGCSQQEVAQLLGVSRPAYTYYERGKTLPDVVGLYQLARFYHKPMEAFFQPCPESKKEDIP